MSLLASAALLVSCSMSLQTIDHSSCNLQNDPRRVVVIGDVHGAWDNFKRIATETGLIDEADQWIAHDTILVQMGDLIHRREQNVEVVQKVFEFQEMAEQFNSRVCLLMGNHDFEQLKWDPSNKGAFVNPQQRSWFMPDYQQFYELKLHEQLRRLQLIVKINGFVFTHAGIERKHLEAAGTNDVDAINNLMGPYFEQVAFENQNDAQFAVQRKVATAVWLQWLHDFKRKEQAYCHRSKDVLDMLEAHTMVLGHYFPSSQANIHQDCDASVVYSDVGIWYDHLDALIIENGTMRTLAGNVLEQSAQLKSMLDAELMTPGKEEL